MRRACVVRRGRRGCRAHIDNIAGELRATNIFTPFSAALPAKRAELFGDSQCGGMVLGGEVALRRKGIPSGGTTPQVPLRGVRFRVWMSCSSSRLQVGSAGAEGGSDQSLKRSHGRVLWAIDALMCSGVDPSRFVARWFQSIAPNCMRCVHG